MANPRKRSEQFLGFANPSAPAPESPLSVAEVPRVIESGQDTTLGPEEDRPVYRAVLRARQREASSTGAAASWLGGGSPRPRVPAASERLFDAWHASYSDPVSLLLARKHLEGGGNFVHLFPTEDDRLAPPDVRASPWHGICSLAITAPGGHRWAGTGWLAGPRTVITAGHCLFMHGRGGVGQWAEQVEVDFPNLGDSPQAVRATAFWSVQGWVEGKIPDTDYGAVVLPDSVRLPEEVALRGGTAPDAALGRETVAIAGFCTDKQPRMLWVFARNVRELLPRQFRLDRCVFGGLSGSPGMIQEGEDWTVVGMQQDGDFAGTIAVRFTPAVCRNIDSWVRQPELDGPLARERGVS